MMVIFRDVIRNMEQNVKLERILQYPIYAIFMPLIKIFLIENH